MPQDSGRLPLPLEPPEHELDVLAGPQRIGREVRARAVVLTGLRAANRHAVRTAALRVAYLEVREDGLSADVRQGKPLFASELAAQFALPHLKRDPGRLAAV